MRYTTSDQVYIGESDYVDDEFLAHVGTPHEGYMPHSGRYPWGSGDSAYQHLRSFYSTYQNMKAKGLTTTQIAKSMGYNSTEFRDKLTIAREEADKAKLAYVKKKLEDGWSPTAIAKKMHTNESSIRSYKDRLNNEEKMKNLNTSEATTQLILQKIDDPEFAKKYAGIDVGLGTAQNLGITEKQMNVVIQRLKERGYSVLPFDQRQANNPGQFTKLKVLCPPGMNKRDLTDAIYNEDKQIKYLTEHSEDGGRTFSKFETPTKENGGCLDSKRIQVLYNEEGGVNRDGLIEIRPGLKDLSLGGKHYAQVRINVDGTHFAKGMCVYTDDLPDGIDVRINSNKHVGTPLEGDDNEHSVLKNIKKDKDMPYGSSVIQQHYVDDDGNTKLSPLNIVGSKEGDTIIDIHAEGGWGDWRKSLASQFLSKQTEKLAKSQLNISYAEKKDELAELEKISQPEVRKLMLDKFAASCDKDSYELKAAALPRQSSRVLLPFNELKDDECYAPGYKNGEKVILVRYPHATVAEIPTLTVNNNIKKCKDTIGTTASDAIGISHATAETLSGADFDGDTAIVIPTKGLALKTRANSIKPGSELLKLKDFNPSEEYPEKPGMKYMTKDFQQIQMGVVSNLITDMTLKGASDDEIARADKASMVTIDAEKHKLNYQQAYKDFGINELKAKYQAHVDDDGQVRQGASTLISSAKKQVRVPFRKYTKVDPETGKLSYIESHDMVINWKDKPKKQWTEEDKAYHERTGKTPKIRDGYKLKTQVSKKMLEADDADELSSGTRMESVYANYANKLKALANTARKESINTKKSEVSKANAKAYSEEVDSLERKYQEVVKNKPKEREAQHLAMLKVRAVLNDGEQELDKEHKKKLQNNALRAAREVVGSKHSSIDITPKEWEAIQADAISSSRVDRYLASADLDQVRSYAIPKETAKTISAGKKARIKSMKNNGYSLAEIKESCGVSLGTVKDVLYGEEE